MDSKNPTSPSAASDSSSTSCENEAEEKVLEEKEKIPTTWLTLTQHYVAYGIHRCDLRPTRELPVNETLNGIKWTGGIRTKNVEEFILRRKVHPIDIVRAHVLEGAFTLNNWYNFQVFTPIALESSEEASEITLHDPSIDIPVEWNEPGLVVLSTSSLFLEYQKIAPGLNSVIEVEITNKYNFGDIDPTTQEYWLPVNWNHSSNYASPKTFESEIYSGFDNLLRTDIQGGFTYKYAS